MVNTKSQSVKWEALDFSPAQQIFTSDASAHMVSEEDISHKLAKSKSSYIGNIDFYYNKEEGNFHTRHNGQHGSPAFLSNECENTIKNKN